MVMYYCGYKWMRVEIRAEKILKMCSSCSSNSDCLLPTTASDANIVRIHYIVAASVSQGFYCFTISTTRILIIVVGVKVFAFQQAAVSYLCQLV